VAKGDGVREIAKNLKDAGLVRNQVAFFLLERFFVKEKPQAGSFKLSPALSANEIAQKLTVGTEDTWVTIPEGWRSEEILEYLAKVLPGFSQNVSVTDWRGSEGKLFPETYLVPKMVMPGAMKQIFLETFDRKIDFPVSKEQLILASIVEREARTETDRPKVASVLLNRLQIGMKLDVDATVQYAIGYTAKDGWWRKELTIDDLKFQSPYNTYENAGLPPGPICNPGLSSIRAAISPAATKYLYYLTDKNGVTHFATTLEEHNANVAKYLQ
jgi:UPF0755 protein